MLVSITSRKLRVGTKIQMFKHSIVWIVAGLLLLVGAVQQIGCGLYQLGCFRRYNRIIDNLAAWLESTWDNFADEETVLMIRDFVLIAVGASVLIAILF